MRKSLAILLFAGCTSSATGDDGPPPNGTGILEPPPAGEGIQLSLVHTLAPGQEIHWCQYKVLDEAIDVGRFEHAYSQGSHHILAYTTPFTAATVPITTDFDCENGANETFNGVAYAGGVPVGQLEFPADVGFHFDAGTVILVEGHYLNPTDAPIDAEVAVNFWKTAAPPTQQAGTLFFYDNNIFVPAGGTYTAHMNCEISQDIHVVSLLSHMHSRGVRFKSDALLPGGTTMPLVYTDQWLNPEPQQFEAQPLAWPAGTRIDYACDYRDTTGTAVMEGPSKTNNEMCMLIGAYWPRMDFGHELCAAPGSGSVYDGTQTCGQSLGCLQSATDPLVAERCFTNTCKASSGALDGFQGCVFQKCIATGKCTGGSDCGSCAFSSCQAEVNSCMAATCN